MNENAIFNLGILSTIAGIMLMLISYPVMARSFGVFGIILFFIGACIIIHLENPQREIKVKEEKNAD